MQEIYEPSKIELAMQQIWCDNKTFEVTEDQINAQYKDGVLTLEVEKPEEQKPKQITIN